MSAVQLQNSQCFSPFSVDPHDLQLLESLQKILKVQLATLGPSPEAVTSYNNIGLIHCNRQEWDSAFEAFTSALNMRIDALGANHLDVAKSYINLGNVYYLRKIYNQALELFQKALNIQLSTDQVNYPDMAKSYSNIGTIYYKEGKYNQAFQYYQTSVMLLSERPEKYQDTVADVLTNALICIKKIPSFNDEHANKMHALCVHTFGTGHPLSQKFISIFEKYY